jgi:hypothetical protein
MRTEPACPESPLTKTEQIDALTLARAIADDAGFVHISALIEVELERLTASHPDDSEVAA